MAKPLGMYQNGNYTVCIFDDGTKIRETNEDEFLPAFAENCDCKITDLCDGACPMCYEGCTPAGKHGRILDYKFLDTLHPYTELAINGNDLSHPDLIEFLTKMREHRVIVNMTVNQIHFEREYDCVKGLIGLGLIHGLGVSLRKATPEFVDKIKTIPNAVIHVINGIFTEEDYAALKDKGLKMLILGYKALRRGADYFEQYGDDIVEKMRWLHTELDDMTNHFAVISFDNLAISQLNVKRLLTDEQWEEFYMGDDGKFTFYLDLVEGTFGKNSLATTRYPIMDNIDDMFQKILAEKI